uniref:Leucine-rich repeat-containing N-terminal plant-type domain-containing protein n=1 Tax=Ananas comosus var. bracteatus TaxID=296719 RepID=A0A6V7PTP1_ANACO|nr:unnamed protein product [Ananas comosus var. bracteatus]
MAKLPPLFYILLLVLVLLPRPAKSSTSYSTDLSALLAIKARITSDPFNVLSRSWSTNSSLCSWVGVACGRRHVPDRVTALSLASLSLEGSIAPHIANLSFLTALDLSNNSLSGLSPMASAAFAVSGRSTSGSTVSPDPYRLPFSISLRSTTLTSQTTHSPGAFRLKNQSP